MAFRRLGRRPGHPRGQKRSALPCRHPADWQSMIGPCPAPMSCTWSDAARPTLILKPPSAATPSAQPASPTTSPMAASPKSHRWHKTPLANPQGPVNFSSLTAGQPDSSSHLEPSAGSLDAEMDNPVTAILTICTMQARIEANTKNGSVAIRILERSEAVTLGLLMLPKSRTVVPGFVPSHRLSFALC
jgi:hypothetical protein